MTEAEKEWKKAADAWKRVNDILWPFARKKEEPKKEDRK
jgi:hypothetical protein